MHNNSHRELCQFQTLLTLPSTWLIDTIEPIPGQEGGRRKHPSHTCFIYNVSKEALSDAGLGDSYKPKKYTSYWCSICKRALCIDPCFRLYHIERTTQVKYWKLLEWVWSLFKKMLNMFKQMLNMSKEATQLNWDNLTAWAYIVHVLKYLRVWFIMSSYCQWSSSVVSYI